MMKFLKILLLIANFLTSPIVAAQTPASSHSLPDKLQGMRWLNTADPETYFREDIANSRFRFFEVLGYSSEILEVGSLNYGRCYKANIQLDRIEGTSDMLLSLEQAELNSKASIFASTYNKLMRSHADSHGLSSCKEGSDWDEAVDKIGDYVMGENQDEGLLGYEDTRPTVTLKIDLKEPKRTKNVVRFACKALRENKITETVNVKISEWLPPPGYHVKQLSTWACKSGSATRKL